VNLTVLFGIVSLVVWVVLAFMVAVPAGWVHLFYAAAVVLFARRVIGGPGVPVVTGGRPPRAIH